MNIEQLIEHEVEEAKREIAHKVATRIAKLACACELINQQNENPEELIRSFAMFTGSEGHTRATAYRKALEVANNEEADVDSY